MITGALLGMTAGLGGLFVVVGWRGRPARVRTSRAPSDAWSADPATGFVAAALAYLVTGWPVGGAVAGLGSVVATRAVRGARSRAVGVARADAVAAWAEMLRDTMAAAAGLEEAIAVTAPLAPVAIRAEVEQLVDDLRHDRPAPALREFADRVSDPAADLVATALALASEGQARDLGRVLDALATATRAETALTLRTEAGRARLRTATRVVISTTVGFGGLLVAFNRPFLAPYDDALGQAWLLVVAAVFGLALWSLDRMSEVGTRARLITKAVA